MGSVVVHWRGTGVDAVRREELLGFIERLAAQHERRWSGPEPQRPKFLEVVTAQRSQGLDPTPRVRRFAGELAGNVLVASDVFADPALGLAQAQARGIRLTPPEPDLEGFLLHVPRIGVAGLDFQLFDPRQLYPAEDRVSFVFVTSAELPALNGRLALVAAHDVCRQYNSELVQAADWYLTSPSVHLRYLFENWFDLFLGWVKYFFLEDLYFWRYEELPGYAQFATLMDEASGRDDTLRAELKGRVFEMLLRDADGETDDWIAKMATW